MIKKNIVINNKLGLHARAAAKLVEQASRHLSEIWVIKGEKKVNAKSIMGIMMLAISKGSEIEILIEGEDENDAMKDLVYLIENKFYEGE